MGSDITNQTRPLSEEEIDYTRRMLNKDYEHYFSDIISDLNGHKDPMRFGIETEYHCVDSKLEAIPDSASRIISIYPEVIGDCADFMLELNSSPFMVIDQGAMPCLEEMIDKESKMRRAVKEAYGSSPLPIGLLPTFTTEQTLLDHVPNRMRAQIINPYIMEFMKPSDLVFFERDTGEEINFGKMPGGGLMNSLHISISGKDDRQSALLYNIANSLCGPMIAVAANSPLVAGKIASYEDSHLFVYEQNREVEKGIPRVGNFPRHLDTLHDYFKGMLEFNPIFKYDEKDPLGSLHNHFSSTWPWIRAQVKGFYRVEFRPIPKQPTLAEDLAVSSLYVYSLLALREELGEKLGAHDSIQEFCRHNLLPEEYLISNTQQAAALGFDAHIAWEYHGAPNIVPVSLVLEELFDKAMHYATDKGVGKDNIDILKMVEPRIKNKLNPSRRLRKETEQYGFMPALENYHRHTVEDRPYIA